MTEPTKEQIQKFWQWCGFRQVTGSCWLPPRGCDNCEERKRKVQYRNEERRIFPEPKNIYGKQDYRHPYELPPLDLNNLFKYAVPKLIPLDGTAQGGIEFKVYPGGIYCILTLQDEAGFNETRYFLEGKHDPALALFWAIWEVIGGKDG